MLESSPNLSALAAALIKSGKATVNLSGAAGQTGGMLVCVGVEDAYGSAVVQHWLEVAGAVNRLVDKHVLDFMRDVYEPGHPAVDLIPVASEYYELSWSNRLVEAELMTLALQAAKAGAGVITSPVPVGSD